MRTCKFLAAVLGMAFLAWCGQDMLGGEPAPAKPKPVKKVYIMTDMEGVAGVRDAEQWCGPDGRYYDVGQKFLTDESALPTRAGDEMKMPGAESGITPRR